MLRQLHILLNGIYAAILKGERNERVKLITKNSQLHASSLNFFRSQTFFFDIFDAIILVCWCKPNKISNIML